MLQREGKERVTCQNPSTTRRREMRCTVHRLAKVFFKIILHFTGRIAVCTGYGTLPITGAFQIELLYNTVQMFQVQFRLIAVHFSAQSGEISRDHIACVVATNMVCFYFTLSRSFQSNGDNKSMPIKTCLICPNINPPRR